LDEGRPKLSFESPGLKKAAVAGASLGNPFGRLSQDACMPGSPCELGHLVHVVGEELVLGELGNVLRLERVNGNVACRQQCCGVEREPAAAVERHGLPQVADRGVREAGDVEPSVAEGKEVLADVILDLRLHTGILARVLRKENPRLLG
jgi:hypothetical protein